MKLYSRLVTVTTDMVCYAESAAEADRIVRDNWRQERLEVLVAPLSVPPDAWSRCLPYSTAPAERTVAELLSDGVPIAGMDDE
jgi:hypothetical protein